MHIEAQVELVAEIRAREDSSQCSKVRTGRLNRKNSSLIVALVAGEEESAIFANRPAEPKAELAALKERIRILGVMAEAGISGQIMTAIEVEAAAVKVFAAGTRHDIDRAVRSQAGREIEVHG